MKAAIIAINHSVSEGYGGDDGARTRDLCRDRSAFDRNPLKLWALMANKSTQKQWKTRVETPSAPYSAPSTFFSRLLPSAGRGRRKNGPVPLLSRGLARFDRCRWSAEVAGRSDEPNLLRQRSGPKPCASPLSAGEVSSSNGVFQYRSDGTRVLRQQASLVELGHLKNDPCDWRNKAEIAAKEAPLVRCTRESTFLPKPPEMPVPLSLG
jgi:hypothetical protein